MAVVRGVEFGFSLARAARGGMVSANDSRGRQIAARVSVHGEDTMATANLPLGTGRTLYSRGGDWFGRFCQYFMILLMLRLGVGLLGAEITRWRGAAKRVRPAGVVSVDVVKPGPAVAQEMEEENPNLPPATSPARVVEQQLKKVRSPAHLDPLHRGERK